MLLTDSGKIMLPVVRFTSKVVSPTDHWQRNSFTNYGQAWQEITSHSNCNVIHFHTYVSHSMRQHQSPCVIYEHKVKKHRFNGAYSDHNFYTLISIS